MANSYLGNLSNCWRFNDSLVGVNGQPFIIPSPAYEAAKFGNGLRMNGTLPSIGPAIGSAVATGPFPWTMMCWFKPDSFSGWPFVLTSKNALFGGFELVNVGDGTLRFSLSLINGSSVSIINPTVLSLTEFNLLIFGYDSVTRKSFLRVNDVQADYSGVFDVPPTIGANLTVGNRATMTSASANGVINLLTAWYGRALPVADMQGLWNGGVGLDYPFA